MKSGVIIINKEAGWTSFDVVAKLRRILGIKKIGHTGTLDPDATGVLAICVGKATRLVEKLSHADKVYEAGLLLGRTTDTQDISGEILSESKDYPNIDALENCINSFIGELEQIPPMYSAKKVNGKKLYELARAGKEIERKPSHIRVYDINITKPGIPNTQLRVRCSSGTYIRTLCNDIGNKLGCGGCMSSLNRTRVGDFMIEDSFKISEIEELVQKNDFSFVLPIDSFYREYPRVDGGEFTAKIIENGGFLPAKMLPKEIVDTFRLYHPDGRFAGIYKLQGNLAKPVKMFLE